MQEPTMNIKIGDLPAFDFVINVELDQSWEQLTDFGVISIPRNIKTLSGKDVAKLIKRGDRIEIDLGYDGDNEREFTGYVTDVTAGYPLLINFEDSMFLLKKNPVNISGSSISLKELIGQIIPSDMKFKAVDAQIGAYRYSKVTPAQILQQLQEERGIYSHFRGEELIVGFAYDFSYRKINYDFDQNIKEDHNQLQYRFGDDYNYKVNVISILPNNEKIELTIGDNDGETRTLHFYNITTEGDLRRLAEEELKKMKTDGWRGQFRTFGYPRVEHGDLANITDPDFPEYERGTHFIDRVKTYSGINGYYRDITPGRLAS